MSMISRWKWCAPLGSATVMLLLSGCGGGPTAVTPPDVDGATAAANALKTYDANGDQALGSDELAKVPGLLALVPSTDSNSDGKLTRDELATRLTQLMGPRTPYTNISVTVTVDGQLVEGATVKFRPLEIFGDEVPPAEATTDRNGAASPAIAQDRLPAETATGADVVFPGVYAVEITHPTMSLPERYNTASELFAVVDPMARDGGSFRFDLKSR